MVMLANFSSYSDKQNAFCVFLNGFEHERRHGSSLSYIWTLLQPCSAQTSSYGYDLYL